MKNGSKMKNGEKSNLPVAELSEKVLADRDKFALRLGYTPSQFEKVVKMISAGGIWAAIGGLSAKALLTTPVVFFGVTLPFTWPVALGSIVTAAIAAFVLGSSAEVIRRKIFKKMGKTGKVILVFDISESKLAKVVADIVFRPLAALAIPLRNKGKREKYILEILDDWGYDENWAKGFMTNLEGLSQKEILKPTIDIISVKGFGELKVDKEVSKENIMAKAIDIMEEATQAHLGLGQKRLQKIRQQLKDKFQA